MRGWLSGLTRAGLMAASAALALWGLAQAPLTLPLVERSAEHAARAIEGAYQRHFTPEEAATRIRDALAAGDALRALWLADLAAEAQIALPEELARRIDAERAAREGAWAATKDCAACAFDLLSCTSFAQIGLCALPVELSPVGDLNALRRQGVNYLSDEAVDPIETGLALVGLAASTAVVATGGGSAVIKAGATVLRGARRLGALSPALSRMLAGIADLPLDTGALLRRAPLEEITDTAALARYSALAGDIGRIAKQTSGPETLLLLRHIDGPEDAARLARVAEISGARTASRAEVLGKSRLFRASLRLSDLALSALAAIWAGVTGLLAMLASALMRALLRALRPGPRRPG